MRRRRPGDGDGRRAAALSAPLLLIPGLGQGSWVWRDFAEAFGRDVLLLDHGGTGPLADVPAHESVAAIAEDAAALVEAPAHVLGFSMGGYVALTLTLARPELVRSLVLVGTGGGGPGRVPRPVHVARAFEEAFGLPHEEFGRRTLPYTLSPGWAEANPERFEQILTARLERPTPYETIEAHVRACYRFYDEGCEAESIDVPALVIHGDEDLIVPVENGRMLAARLRDVEYVELPRRGHNLMLEIPDELAALVKRFVSSVDAAVPRRPSTPSRP